MKKRGTNDPVALKTLDTLVKDTARNQALSASLVNLIERNALGFPPFSTVTAYADGDIVFYDRRLYKFTAAKAAGAWDSTKVTEFSIKEYSDALSQIDISLSVVAEALLYLYNENKALRELLAGKDNAVLPVVKAQSVECDDILTLGVPNVLVSGVAGAPSAANVPDNWNEETMTVWDGCPRKVGQQYVDKASKKVYYAVAVTGSTSDWVALN